MLLRKATLIVAVGIMLSLAIRVVGTFYTEVFKYGFVVKVSIVVNTFFILFQVLFWLLFLLEYVTTRKKILKTACVGVIAACVAISLIYIKNLLLVFNVSYRLPMVFYSPWYDALVPFVSSIIHLNFFLAFKSSVSGEERIKLNGAIISAIGGTLFFLVLHLLVLLNYIISENFQWREHMPGFVAVGTIPLLIIAVLLIFNFYKLFYQYLKRVEDKTLYLSTTIGSNGF